MNLLTVIFSVLTGLAFGSFLNVCIARLPEHQSVGRPRSRCPHCGHPIRDRDNIPVLSWLLLRGKCRDCGAGISVRYPVIELATAALFLLCELSFGLTLRGIGSGVLCFLLLGLAAMDAESYLLPDAFTLPGIGLGILFTAWKACCGPTAHLRGAGRSLLAAIAAALLILAVRGAYWLVRRREGMGLGDAKLLAMIAAWMGPWMTILVLFFGAVSAAIYGIFVLIFGSFRAEKTGSEHPEPPLRLPFGSFLCAAGILALFQGRDLLNLYMSFIR